MMKDSVTREDVVALLNQALMLDENAMKELVFNRVACNKHLAMHPTIQVALTGDNVEPGYKVGLIGILNGLFGVKEDGSGCIAAKIEISTGKIVEFGII